MKRRGIPGDTGKDRRRAILEAARAEFAAHGFTSASMRRIAVGTGCSVSNLYEYFPNKDALFCALVEPIKSDFERYALQVMADDQAIAQDRDQTTDHALAASKEMSHALVRYVLGHRDDLRLLFLTAAGSSLEDASREYMQAYQTFSAEYFATDPTEGSVRIMAASPQLRTILFGQTLAYLMELIRSDIDETQAIADVDLLVEFTFAGFNAVARWWHPPR